MIGRARSPAAASIIAASRLYKDLVISHTLDGRLDRDGQGDRPGQVAAPSRQSGQGRGHHRSAAHREEHGDHRRGRRRIRNSRLDRGDRSRHAERGLAHLHAFPAKGEPGSETWKAATNSAETTGGGSTWVTGSYDPDDQHHRLGRRQSGPGLGQRNIGPATTSTLTARLRLDADTGKIKWHFQHTPNDPYDYDSVAENVLVDVPTGKKLALEADRNGFAYAVDRTTASSSGRCHS